MIEELAIRDLALLDSARVGFHAGLNVLSGETGGGKSLVVLALKLLRGERAGAEIVRSGAKAAVVDGVFVFSEGERSRALRTLCTERLGLELEEDRLIVTRVVESSGRSRALVNQRPVSLAVLKEVGEHLVEVHGQGEARSLMRPGTQTEILDSYAGTSGERKAFAASLAETRALAEALAEARTGRREREERVAFLRFQAGEIDRAAVVPGEVARLEEDHGILSNVDRLRRLLGEAGDALRESEDSVLDRLARVARAVAEAGELDPRLSGALGSLAEATMLLEDAHAELRSGVSRLEVDPGRLAEVEARLADVRALLQRFGPREEDLFASRSRIGTELDRLSDPGSDAAVLEERLAAGKTALLASASGLTKKRMAAAGSLAREVERELRALSMGKARVEFRVGEVEAERLLETASHLGPSEVEIFLAANPGEPLLPLRKVASGGEAARVMLAIKERLADTDRVPVLVFDEIDAEIGGRLGLALGEKLRRVARLHQVICVTHLPQIAAFADQHVKVGKHVESGRTRSTIEVLDGDRSAAEIAAMARGDAVDAEALAEARRLIDLARQTKGS